MTIQTGEREPKADPHARDDDDDLISAKQLGDQLGVHWKTALRLAATNGGPIPNIKIGRNIRFRLGAVRAWQREEEAASQN